MLPRIAGAALLAVVGFAAPAIVCADDGPGLSIGRTVERVEVRDVHGNRHTLDALGADSRLIVVAFLGCECPLARLYAPRLAQLHEEYAERGVAFLGINSNRQDTLSDVEHYMQAHQLSFAVFKDPGNIAADRFGATRTPEVFVLDTDRVIRYQGRIDDERGFHDGLLYQRSEIPRRDLATALDELLADRPVTVPRTEAVGCLIGREREPDLSSRVTWSDQIAGIFQRRCQQCHRPGEIGPFSLLTYEDTLGWEGMIAEVVSERRMPPWHANPEYGEFANDARLSDEELQQILTWVEHGAPEGDPANAPPPRQFTNGWQIPEPDQVVYIADEPFDVPAEGIVDYQYFVVDPGFTEDRWIAAAEARPGNRAVVHHINVFILLPEMGQDLSRKELAELWKLQNHMLCGYVPGMRPTIIPSGMAKRIPAGAQFVFQLHYTPNGTPQQDRSFLGLRFADPATVEREVTTVPAMNPWFEIPPHAADHRVETRHILKADSLILSFLPHMHLRGKSFRYVAHYPDGSEEVLLDVPRYDFNWQTTYALAEPKRMPSGTRIECVAHFDNSADNPANPDPEATVRWGEQTWDEMMIGYFDVVPLGEPALATSPPVRRLGMPLAIATAIAALTGIGLFIRRSTIARATQSHPADAPST